MNTPNFYYLRTINGHQYLNTAKTPACSIGKKGIIELVTLANSKVYDTSNWDELKGIEYMMICISASNGYPMLTSESLFYGKKYIAITIPS